MIYRFSEDYFRIKKRQFRFWVWLISVLVVFFCLAALLAGKYYFLLLIGLWFFYLRHLYREGQRDQAVTRKFSLEVVGDQLISRGEGFEHKRSVKPIKKVILQKSWFGKTRSIVLRFGFFEFSVIKNLENLDGLAREIADAIHQEKIPVARFFHHE